MYHIYFVTMDYAHRKIKSKQNRAAFVSRNRKRLHVARLTLETSSTAGLILEEESLSMKVFEGIS